MAGMGLAREEIEHWNAHGYVVVRGALEPGDLAPMIADYEAIVEDRAQELLSAGRIKNTYAGEPFDTRFARICEMDSGFSSSHLDEFLDIGHGTARGQTRGTFELMRCPRLMAIIEPILGSPEIGWSPISHVRAKLPAAISAESNVAGWHQDAIFVTEDADDNFLLTVWLPVTEASVEMGCLEIMPGTHAEKTVYWHSPGQDGMGQNLPRRPTVHEPVSPGDVILLHKLCPHGSGPNHSDKVRWSMDMRYTLAGLPSGRDCWPAFTAQSRVEEPHSYDDWRRRWQQALELWPQRQGRQITPEGPVPYTGAPPSTAGGPCTRHAASH